MFHADASCRERLRLKRFALMMMQRAWTGVLAPYLEMLSPDDLKRKIIERDFQLLVSLLEHEDHGCQC